MLESLVLAMDVSQEVLCTFGKVHNGLKVDDFLGCVGNRRERLRQQVQIVHVRIGVFLRPVIGKCPSVVWGVR